MITSIVNKLDCSGCCACVSTCPERCISMSVDTEGFSYPRVDMGKCIHCGLCEIRCPILNPITSNTAGTSTAYAALNKSEEIRSKSSSGGVFSLLAEYIIELGGVVFGAGFTSEFEVKHICVKTFEELDQLRGSKYVQSKIGDAFQKAQSFLDRGRLVLFSGTPCQIGGLLAFLKKDYDNLITQDVICHGVPSPLVWRQYLAYREKHANSLTLGVSFRRKDEGWKRYSVLFKFKNGTEYRQLFYKDPMMIAFLRNICLRPSCYRCSYKTVHRKSDFSLADFWGVQDILPEMDDDKGTSLVLVHSAKGRRVFEEIEKKMFFEEVNIESAIRYNSAIISSVTLNTYREDFLAEIAYADFEKTVRKYCRDSYFTRGKKMLHYILSKTKKAFFRLRR